MDARPPANLSKGSSRRVDLDLYVHGRPACTDDVLELPALPDSAERELPYAVSELLDQAARTGNLFVDELVLEGKNARLWRVRHMTKPWDVEVALIHWIAASEEVGTQDRVMCYAHNPRTKGSRIVAPNLLRYTFANIAAGRMHLA
jgi:hypothetical protein